MIIRLTPNETRVAEDRCGCYWLYVVTNCAVAPELDDQRKDAAALPWHEMTSVAHYYAGVDALKRRPAFSDALQMPFEGSR